MNNIIVNDKKYEIIVIGMGYVGLTYSLHINAHGYNVVGIENNDNTRKLINKRILPFFEDGLQGRLNNFVNQGLLKTISPIEYEKSRTNLNKIYMVTVGTPIVDKKLYRESLNKVFDFLKDVVEDEDGIILRSTVALGLTREYCESFDKSVYYCFAPERTIEGKAVHELSTIPQVFGSNDHKSRDFFNNFFAKVSSEVKIVSTTETAELVKLTSNVYRDVIFGFSNEISLISHKQKIDVKEVIDACNYKYPRCNIYSSGPVGGPCLSKDSYILADSIDESQTKSIILNARRLNENYVIEILNTLIKNVKKASILGISFKGQPLTNDTRDSYAIKIIEFLNKNNINVSAYDPVVFDEDFEKIGIKRDYSVQESFENKDLIIIQNNNPIFKRMDLNKLSELTSENSIILDLWSLHPQINLVKSKYIGL